MRTKIINLAIVLSFLSIISLAFTVQKKGIHLCKWSHCPYNYMVNPEVKEVGDTYLIDNLHLQYPDMDYDQLEAKLIANNQ